jgi:hypothetical protein
MIHDIGVNMEFDYTFIPVSLFKQEYRLSEVQEYAEMAIYATVAFALPFLLGGQQLLVGSVVNCVLVLAALNIRGKKLLPVILLPSVGAYLAGMIFGVASSALLIMIPFIWVGNSILVFSMKKLTLSMKKNRILSLGVGAAVKSGFLFLAAFILFSFGFVPAVFLTAMGIVQLVTASVGGATALVLQEGKKRIG